MNKEENKAINLAAPNQQKRGFILRSSTRTRSLSQEDREQELVEALSLCAAALKNHAKSDNPEAPASLGAEAYNRAVSVLETDVQRVRFEEWINQGPYEMDTERYSNDASKSDWPGQYTDMTVQFAWEVWQEALKA